MTVLSGTGYSAAAVLFTILPLGFCTVPAADFIVQDGRPCAEIVIAAPFV